jgi:hypothetical protein
VTPHLFADIVRQIQLFLAEMDLLEGNYWKKTSQAKQLGTVLPQIFSGFQITSYVGMYFELLLPDSFLNINKHFRLSSGRGTWNHNFQPGTVHVRQVTQL